MLQPMIGYCLCIIHLHTSKLMGGSLIIDEFLWTWSGEELYQIGGLEG